MRSELGRHSLSPYKCSRAIKYWLRIINLPNDRLPKLCYKLQRRWTETDTDCWATQVRNLLFIKVFKTRLLDMDIQTQNSDIHVQDMDKLRTYKLLKLNFGCEDYMFCIANRMFRTAFSRFRGGLLKLECNGGRYNNIPFNEMLCPLCKSDVETEFHFLLVCTNVSQTRSKYISFIWYTYPSINKFIQLCTSKK